MSAERFQNVSRVYWDALGISGLDTFLDEKPPLNRTLRWHFYRKIYFFLVFMFYPFFITVQIWGIITAETNTLKQISFDISLLGYNIQNLFKLFLWQTRIKSVRSFCLEFSKFHVNNYRPNFSSWVFEKKAKTARNFTGRCYWISYANLLFWIVLPTTFSLGSYLLYVAGLAEARLIYIPRYSPSRFPFDMSLQSSRILVGLMELFLFTFGFLSFQPIDMFFAAVIQMAQSQFSVLNSALFSMDGELQDFMDTDIPVKDEVKPMDMSLFVKDHQEMIRYGVRLRKFLNPILGLETLNCVTIICNMTIVARSQFSEEGEFLQLAFAAFSSLLVVFTCLVVFYTFTSMTGELKDAEESVFKAVYASNWLQRDVKHRKTIILIQKQTMAARRIKLFSIGDMGRSTFIDGLRTVYTYYNFMQRFK